MLKDILAATAEYNPTVFTEATEEYPTLREGDAVIIYNDDLTVVYENGETQILYGDWVGNFENPLPLLQLILNGNIQTVHLEALDEDILVVKDDVKLPL